MRKGSLLRSPYSRLIIAAAVFLLFIGSIFIGRAVLEKIFPEKVITSFRELEREGLKWYERGGNEGFKSTKYDSHLFIDGGGSPIRAIEIEILVLKHNKHFPESTMEVFFDVGNGFNEQDSIKAHVEEGTNRIDFDSIKPVSSVRIDFFNNTKCFVRLDHITLNPRGGGNVLLLCIVSFLSLLFFAMLSLKRDSLSFVGGLLLWAAICFAAGIPFLRDVRGTLTFPYCAAMLLASCLFGTFLLEEGEKREKLFTLAITAAAFCLYFYWASITPYAEGPDEAMHHDVVYYICRTGKLPAGYEPSIRNEIWGFSYAYYPYLSYILGGYMEYLLTRLGDPTWQQMVLLARMVPVLCGTLTVFFASRLAGVLWKKRPIRYVLPVFVAFLPELAFINTYINNDAMGIMSTAMILYFWARGCENDWQIKDAAGLSISMGICALTYYNCYGFILMSIPLFFYTAAKGRRDAKGIAKTTAFIVCCTFLVCGWWFIRNAILYQGDLLGRNTLNHYAELYAMDGYKPSQLSNPKKEGYTLFQMMTELEWVQKTLRSFIAMFSTYTLRAKHFVYVLYKVFLGAGIIGGAVAGVRALARVKEGGAEAKKKAAFWICLLGALLIVLALAIYYSYEVDFQPQGRYILPCVLPLGCIITAGFSKIGECLGTWTARKDVPERILAGICCALSACLMIQILLDTVIRYYL